MAAFARPGAALDKLIISLAGYLARCGQVVLALKLGQGDAKVLDPTNLLQSH